MVDSSWTYSNLIINGSGGTFNNPATGALNINQTMLVQAGTFNQNTVPITVNAYTQTGGTFMGGTAPMSVNTNFTLSGGASFSAPTSNNNLSVSGNWTNNATFLPQTGTVLFNANSALIGNTTFYNFTGLGAITLTFPATSTQTVNNALTLTGVNQLNLLNLRSSTPGVQAYLRSTGPDNITLVSVQDSNASANTLASVVPSTITSNTTNWEVLQKPNKGGSGGSTETSPQNRIVQNGYGIWIFFNQSGTFQYASSLDGNTWNNPANVFGSQSTSGEGSIYYDSVSSTVYAVATQSSGRGSYSNSTTPNNVWITSATLNASALPFVSFSAPTPINMLYASGGQNSDYTIWGNGEVGISLRSGAHDIGWIVTESCKDGTTNKNRYNVVEFFTATLAPASAVTTTTPDSTAAGPFLGGGPVVVPTDNSGDMIIMYTHDGGIGTPSVYASAASPSATQFSQPNVSPEGPVASGLVTVNDDLHSISAIFDGASTVHLVGVDSSSSLFYSKYVSGVWTATSTVTSSAQTPSLGLSFVPGASQLYVVYQQAAGRNINYAVSPISAPSWVVTSPWELIGTSVNAYPHVTSQNNVPVPPRVLWQDTGPNAYFGTLYLNSAPTLTGVSPQLSSFITAIRLMSLSRKHRLRRRATLNYGSMECRAFFVSCARRRQSRRLYRRQRFLHDLCQRLPRCARPWRCVSANAGQFDVN